MSTLFERYKELQGYDKSTAFKASKVLLPYRGAEKRAEIPNPMCCLKAAVSTILKAKLNVAGKPTWHLKVCHEIEAALNIVEEAAYCPFCGETLPEFRKKVGFSDPWVNEPKWLQSLPISAWEVDYMADLTAATALIFHPENPAMVLGVSRKDNHNDFGLPGGRIEPRETPEQCMVRELYEETGLRAIDWHLVFEAYEENRKVRAATYMVTKFEGCISTQEAGVAAWVPSLKLVDETSTFRDFNKALFKVLEYNP